MNEVETPVPSLEDLSDKACFIGKHVEITQRLIESFRQDGLRGSEFKQTEVDSLVVIAEDVVREAKELLEGAQAFTESSKLDR